MKKMIVLITALLMVCLFAGSALALPYPDPGPGFDRIIKDGSDFSDAWVENKNKPWFDQGDGSIMSPWQSAWVEYTANLAAYRWDIGLNAINYGSIGTDWYDNYILEAVLMDEGRNVVKSAMLYITASETEENYDFFTVGISEAQAGLHTVRYTWLNDKRNSALNLDANIMVTSAFFYDPAPVPEPSTLLLLGLGLLAGVGLRRKK